MNIIDTLTAGFSMLTKRIWLLIIPVVLDVFLWLGPKVSIAPVIDKLALTFQQALATMGTANGVDANMTQMFDQFITELQGTVGRTNLLTLLATTRLGMPSIAGLRLINPAVDRVIAIADPLQMAFWQFLIMMVGLLIGCLFLGLLGQAARGEDLQLGKVLQRTPIYWLYLLLLFVPLGVILAIAFFSSAILGPFAFLVWVVILWMLFYLSFVPQAITLAEGNPLQAMMSSFIVVRFNFWSTLGLFLLVNMINLGLGLIFRMIMISNIGVAVAILANAFVGTGLSLSWFIFYRDRLLRLRESLERQQVGATHE